MNQKKVVVKKQKKIKIRVSVRLKEEEIKEKVKNCLKEKLVVWVNILRNIKSIM